MVRISNHKIAELAVSLIAEYGLERYDILGVASNPVGYTTQSSNYKYYINHPQTGGAPLLMDWPNPINPKLRLRSFAVVLVHIAASIVDNPVILSFAIGITNSSMLGIVEAMLGPNSSASADHRANPSRQYDNVAVDTAATVLRPAMRFSACGCSRECSEKQSTAAPLSLTALTFVLFRSRSSEEHRYEAFLPTDTD
nr:hypothetical protein CFP56_02648 [Quercus suber]